MNSFAYWRDGQCIERFEPGFAGTRPPAPHRWWDVVQQQLDAAGTEYPGLVPVLKAVALHTDAVLDTDTLNGPLLTLLLDDNSRTPDPPPQPRPAPHQPPGRFLGTAVPDPPSPPSVTYALIRPADQHTQGVKPEE
ncbi:hypothetical protein KBZ00_07445 [Streptomyces sp. RK31]|nr:hypothetical protein [Streptomyces sp. RK31]